MAAAGRARPELIRGPRHPGSRIAHDHLRTAALATNVALKVGHEEILALWNWGRQGCGKEGQSYDPVVIPAIVLAAGESARMGRPKPNLPVGPVPVMKSEKRETFLTRIVRTLGDAGIDDVVVVLGHEMAAVLASFAESGLAARFVENANYKSGQLSSLVAGLRVVDRPGVVATLVTLVDAPFVSPATVRAVIERYRQTHAPIVRPTRGARHGHPLLVDRTLFDRLRHADPAEGAKAIVRAYATPAGDVEVDDEGAFDDIDTPEEYERAVSAFGQCVPASRENAGPE
jgi:molybdenum cofactor cytidylyltransferase